MELLSRANIRILLELNHWLAAHPALYKLALLLTDHASDALTVVTIVLLWFWPQRRRDSYLLPAAGATKKNLLHARRQHQNAPSRDIFEPLRAWWARFDAPRNGGAFLTRHESRAQTLIFCIAAILGYVTARLIALQIDAPRPFISFLPVRAGVPNAFEGLRTFGSFPSDHAVLLAALPLALFYWNRRLAWMWTALALLLMLTRVAIGFHYPSDMLGGALIGILFVGSAFWLYQRQGKFHQFFIALARGFDLTNTPYCYYLYILLAMMGLELAMHMKHVLDIVFELSGAFSYRFR